MEIIGYKILRKIGEGAMANVFLAVQESLGRQVALKILTPDLACQPGFADRFLNEGRIVAHLSHPRIVNVYDLGANPPNYYMAMELLPGGTLHQKIKSGMTPCQVVQCIKQISRALDFAHKNGVIHRDIKSQNIMFRNSDVPVLTDFGIARLIDGDLTLTIPGRTVGSPLYMSPEQISGRKIDARSDLYSMGILIYEMLTAQLPYRSDQFMAVALMHKTAPIPILPDPLAVFQPVLDKLLAKEPDQRYSSAQQLIEALVQIESENTFFLMAADPPVKETQTERNHSASGGINPATSPMDSFSGDETQPALETSFAKENNGVISDKNNHAPGQAEQRTLKMMDVGHVVPKSRVSRKLVPALVGVLVIVAVGLYVVFQSDLERFTALRRTALNVAPITNEDDTLYPGQRSSPGTIEQHNPVPDAGTQNEAVSRPMEQSDHQEVRDQKIDDLLAKAQTQLTTYRLTLPAGDNCYDTYQQILSLDPSGNAAKSLLIQIGKAYGRLARTAKAEGRLQDGLNYTGKGIELLPDDTTLLALRADLRAGLTEQTRLLQEQARQKDQLMQLRVAEKAAAEERLRVERELEALRQQETEREQLRRLSAERERAEQAKAKNSENVQSEVEQPEAEEEPDSRNRLFGTF